MRVLVNTTTMFIGGGIQAATHFLLQAKQHEAEHEWCLALSSKVFREVEKFGVPRSDVVHVFDKSPAHDLAGRRRLEQLEKDFRADCVFTIYGPAYANFKAPHLLGCVEPWITHSTWMAYRTKLFPWGWIGRGLLSMYKSRWFRRADAWVTEAESARQGLNQRLNIPLEDVAVIPNTCGQHYLDAQETRQFPTSSDKVRFLFFTAPYKHKRLHFLPYVAKELSVRDPKLKFEFVITLPAGDPKLKKVMAAARSLGVVHLINNAGPIPVAEGPDIYRSCNVCFLPSVLETFSASYPEAMAMGLPIVTTDLGFAHDACRDAALYFKPNDPKSAADKILSLLRDERLWSELLAKGKNVLRTLPTTSQKYDLYMDLLHRLGESGRIPDKTRGENNACRGEPVR